MICLYRKANPDTQVPSPIFQSPSSGADPTRNTACPGFVSLHSTLNFSMEVMAQSSPRRFDAAHSVLKTSQVD